MVLETTTNARLNNLDVETEIDKVLIKTNRWMLGSKVPMLYSAEKSSHMLSHFEKRANQIPGLHNRILQQIVLKMPFREQHIDWRKTEHLLFQFVFEDVFAGDVFRPYDSGPAVPTDVQVAIARVPDSVLHPLLHKRGTIFRARNDYSMSSDEVVLRQFFCTAFARINEAYGDSDGCPKLWVDEAMETAMATNTDRFGSLVVTFAEYHPMTANFVKEVATVRAEQQADLKPGRQIGQVICHLILVHLVSMPETMDGILIKVQWPPPAPWERLRSFVRLPTRSQANARKQTQLRIDRQTNAVHVAAKIQRRYGVRLSLTEDVSPTAVLRDLRKEYLQRRKCFRKNAILIDELGGVMV